MGVLKQHDPGFPPGTVTTGFSSSSCYADGLKFVHELSSCASFFLMFTYVFLQMNMLGIPFISLFSSKVL
uniref:Uncharacterized protein n=1 Tax=Rhizophora mucronata TaxID=61149 RepID=A0A2P2ISC1_RHIMU